MLFIIDMQNDYINKVKGKRYITESDTMVEGIIEKIKEYENKCENIFYTTDIPLDRIHDSDMINNKKNIKIAEEGATSYKRWAFEPYHLLKPYLTKHKVIKKSYYALPPETLLEIQEYFNINGDHTGIIEFVGVETHICVLANAICIQSAFPKANVIINASLCKSNNKKDHEAALKIMEGLGMEIRR